MLGPSDRASFELICWDKMSGSIDQIGIDRGAGPSLHQQLYDRIRSGVREGRLAPGARLPSIRALSVHLGVARGTVDAVYARLAGEGYLQTARARGTIVSPEGCPDGPDLSGAPAKDGSPVESWRPLQLGLPALDLFPRKAWIGVLARQARRLGAETMVYPDPQGVRELREEIAAYVAVSRGIACTADQIIVTHGYQDALNLIVDLVLSPGDEVWIEDPGYGFSRRALQARDLTLRPVPVDEEGLCVDWARVHAPRARLSVVTPAHQFPMGVTLSAARRRALLAWAAGSEAWIVEDDYDCEFHYSGHKPAALKALDAEGRVFYVGSFSKVLLPSLRLGYAILPPQLVSAGRDRQALRHRGVAALQQLAVAEFMRQGHFARHLRRMRLQYKARRNALAAALEADFGTGVDLDLRAGGLHILARFPGAADDVELARRAGEAGLKPTPLSGQTLEHHAGEGLLLCFTKVAEEQAPRVSATLRSLTRPA